MGYEDFIEDYEPDLFADHLLKKEKRLRSMERQQHHKQRLVALILCSSPLGL